VQLAPSRRLSCSREFHFDNLSTRVTNDFFSVVSNGVFFQRFCEECNTIKDALLHSLALIMVDEISKVIKLPPATETSL